MFEINNDSLMQQLTECWKNFISTVGICTAQLGLTHSKETISLYPNITMTKKKMMTMTTTLTKTTKMMMMITTMIIMMTMIM